MKTYKDLLWILMAVLLIFSPVARGAVRIWSMAVLLLIELLLIFLWMWKANNSNKYTFIKTGLNKSILAFAILASLSCIFSIYKRDSFYALLRLSGYIGIYYVVVNEFDHVMRRRTLLLAACTGAGLSLYGILQYFGALPHSWWFPQNFLSSTYVNHNHFAGYLELTIPIAMGILIGAKSKTQGSRIILSAALVVMVAALILTQSRGAWISLAISFAIIGVIFIRRKTFNLQTVFIILLFAVIVFSFLYFGKDIISSRIYSIFAVQGEETSLQTRLKIWQGTVDMIRSYPLTGVGIGDFIWAFPRFRPEGLNVQANAAHNDYLQIAAETGIAGLLAMIWLLVTLIGSAIRSSYEEPVKIGCAIGLLSLSLHGLVDFNFHIPANMLLFTVCAAIVMSASRSAEY